MNALVIENGSEPDADVVRFCKKAVSEGWFGVVEYNVDSLHNTPGDLIDKLVNANAILVKSKWLYKDQLEAYVTLLSSLMFCETRRIFYIWDFAKQLDEWLNADIPDIEHKGKFIRNLTTILKHNTVCSVDGEYVRVIFLRVHTKGLRISTIPEHRGIGLY